MVTGSLTQSPQSVFGYHAIARPSHVESIRALLAHRGEYPLETVRSSYLPRLKSQPQRTRRELGESLSPRVHWPEGPDRKEPRRGQALGTASLSSSSRFPPSSGERFVRPVTLPPGRARLSMKPASTGSEPSARHNDGNRLGRILGRPDVRVPSCYHDDINLETHQLGRKLREPIVVPLRISVLNGDVLSFYVAKLAQSQPNSFGTGGVSSCIARDRYPIRGTFFGCCAVASTPQVATITKIPSSLMRCFIAPAHFRFSILR